MEKEIPIIVSAHHASSNYGRFADRCALTDEQRIRYSDYGTANTAPRFRGGHTQNASYSRGIIDLNRGPNDEKLYPTQDFGKPTPQQIWKEGQKPTQNEQDRFFKEIWTPYHNRLTDAIRSAKRPAIVLAWDNTAKYPIGYNKKGDEVIMPSFILSNNGAEHSSSPEQRHEADDSKKTTCQPELLDEFYIEFGKALRRKNLPDDRHLNEIFRGQYVTKHYNSYHTPNIHPDQPVQSIQIDYCADITHDQKKPNSKF